MEKKRLGPRPAPARYPVLRPQRIERSDRCINCGTCITACIYGCHERRADDARKMADPKPACCRNCFACVLRCPRQALTVHPNEEYLALGDQTYTPAVICSIQEQAAEGKIPVSGAGYGGPFDGEGYDNIWTDMSEIVRPTRDGIHGREHISTTVNLGRMVGDLCGMQFDAQGNLLSLIPPNREIPIPVLFGQLPFRPNEEVLSAMALAASQLNTYLTVRSADNLDRLMNYFNHLLIRIKPDEVEHRRRVLEWASIIEIEPNGDQLGAILRAREINPHLLTILRLPARFGVEEEVCRLAAEGAEVIHLSADQYGRGQGGAPLLHCLRETHRALVERGLRDRITLLASGGLAMAEHVPKTIILGADAVVVDVPLLIAMECTVCGECADGHACPRQVGQMADKWGATRIINLILSWRDQLLEVLGAMGMRDVRRLRGEAGRAIFGDQARQEFVARLSKTPNPVSEKGLPAHSAPAAKKKIFDFTATMPRRFSTLVGPHRVVIDRMRCTDCGICADTCRYLVHERPEGKLSLSEPRHHLCFGSDCLANDWCCVHACPWKAITIEHSTTEKVLGDRRWTAALLQETYRQARTGVPPNHLDGELVGASGGGFDRLHFVAPTKPQSIRPEDVDLSIPLNRRAEGPRITIPLPIYGGGMSFGSVSLQVMLGRAKAAQHLGTFTSTGEGGYPPELAPFAEHVITQIATGLFGVREETIQRARLIEFKYAQGAKPGLGGHLLAEKNTPLVAAMREAVPGTGLFSPFPFHSVYSVEDHKKHLDWIRAIHPTALISVKVSTPADVDMVAVGSYYAGANIINLDGAYGGTGAAPDIAKKNIAMPIEYAITQVHDFLVNEGIRDEVTLIASGGIRTPDDVLKAIALGADGCAIGTAELVAIDCVRCGNCERLRGCPLGIATTDLELSRQLYSDWVSQRIVNMYTAWAGYMQAKLAAWGLAAVRQLRGRRDLLKHQSPV